MTIRVLPAPCWILQWDGLPLSSDTAGHYRTLAQAVAVIPGHGRLARHENCGGTILFAPDAWCPACGAESISSSDRKLLTVMPVQLPDPCWIAECDCSACSGELLGEDDGYIVHRATEAEITASTWERGWQVTTEGLVYPDRDSLPPGTLLAARPPALRKAVGQAPVRG
jgi:hypothetical protein